MAGRRVATAIGNGSGEAGGLQMAPKTVESKRIAGLVGPTLIALSASEALNYRIWNDNLAPVTYLDGTLLFVGGLSIVRTHNRWTRVWPLITTLAGWSGLLMGLVRMFAPQARQPGRSAATDGLLLAMFAGGVVLTFQAGRPEVYRR
jgi:hypothetical protein